MLARLLSKAQFAFFLMIPPRPKNMLPHFQSGEAQHEHHPLAWVPDGGPRALGCRE